MPAALKPHLLLIIVNLIYGANYSIAKIAMPAYIGPFPFILIRVAIGVLLFTLVHRLFVNEKVARKDLPLLAACGLFGVAINQLMFFKGLALTSEIHASMIMITTPIIALLASRIILKYPITLLKSLGILIGGGGVAWLILQAGGTSSKSASVTGDLFVLINAASYGIYLVLVTPLLKKYNPLTIVRWVFTFGLIVVTPFGALPLTEVDWAGFSQNAWLALVYVVIFTTFITYLLNAVALKMASPTMVSTYVYTQPLIAGFIAVIIGNDSLSLEKIAAGLLILTGVVMVSAQATSQPKQAEQQGNLTE